MAGRRRGRTGRGWDAAPARPRRAPEGSGSSAGGAAPPPPRDPTEQAREICLRQLSVRPRTRAELAAALQRHGVTDEVIAEVLDRYAEVGMIDDAAFAQAWVISRHHGKGLARRALGSELRRRGVAPETVGEALAGLDGDTEAQTARALVDRKLRATTAARDPQVLVRRLVGMLARKGYPAGLAFRVVKEALADDERTASLAGELDPEALAEASGDALSDTSGEALSDGHG